MKIKTITYSDRNQEWGFEQINFFDLTLLVGISGVGKSQILQAIKNLTSVALGKSYKGLEWDLIFSTTKYGEVIWKGAFENNGNVEDEKIFIFPSSKQSEEIKYKILSEIIIVDGKKMVSRNEDEFIFEEKAMPKLASTESAIKILSEEDSIKEIFDSFGKIVFDDHTQIEKRILFSFKFPNMNERFSSIDKIKESSLRHFIKLGLVYDFFPEVFNEIKREFIDTFVQIVDLRIESIVDHESKMEFYQIEIKEKYVEHWIPQDRISSGMIRTLMHLTEMKLCPKGTVILVDEIENSLGVNCINIITEDLLYNNSDLQYIATSHHPYVISKIPYDNWKIVTRKGGRIMAHDAKDFDLSEDSHHERFMNLVNLPVYKEGISQL